MRPDVHTGPGLARLFAVLTVLPSLLLLAFGWRLLGQDRRLEEAESRTRRDQTAALVVTSLQQTIADLERTLRERPLHEAPIGPGAIALRFLNDGVIAHPAGRLIHYPAVPRLEQPDAGALAALDAAHYRSGDPAAAERLARRLVGADKASVRAVALARLATQLRRSGRQEEALGAYARLAAITSVGFEDVPADLFARWARCELLATMERPYVLRREALALDQDLRDGRWPLLRPVYELHITDARQWAALPDQSNYERDRIDLTAGVNQLHEQLAGKTLTSAGGWRGTVSANGRLLTAIAVDHPEGLTAVVATGEHVVQHWAAPAGAIAEKQSLDLSISARATGSVIVRSPEETHLPWAIALVTKTVEGRRHSTRTQLWVAGLVVLAALSVAGTWIVGRAVSQELAVARLQSEFVAAVSHEFRTPLTTMAQLTEVLLDGRAGTDERRQRYYEALARQTERLRRLVENLLDFARMEAGGARYRFQTMDAAQWVQTVVAHFGGQSADTERHRIHLELAQGAAELCGDQNALTHALWNLLDNAVKYSPAPAEVWVRMEKGDHSVQVSVRDRGIGIPDDEQAHVFGKFVRGAHATSANIQGTGLGLAMVRHIVRAHGGDVALTSATGEGSTFTMTLPLRS